MALQILMTIAISSLLVMIYNTINSAGLDLQITRPTLVIESSQGRRQR